MKDRSLEARYRQIQKIIANKPDSKQLPDQLFAALYSVWLAKLLKREV